VEKIILFRDFIFKLIVLFRGKRMTLSVSTDYITPSSKDKNINAAPADHVEFGSYKLLLITVTDLGNGLKSYFIFY
jgi:hypothetical protein